LTRNCCSSLSAYLIDRGSEGGEREDPNGYHIGTSAGMTIEGHNAYLESIQIKISIKNQPLILTPTPSPLNLNPNPCMSNTLYKVIKLWMHGRGNMRWETREYEMMARGYEIDTTVCGVFQFIYCSTKSNSVPWLETSFFVNPFTMPVLTDIEKRLGHKSHGKTKVDRALRGLCVF
jgi:hypothetical protein